MSPPSRERLQQALASLDRNARAQARLVDDLLDLSRIVAGKLQLKLGLVDITPVVDAAIDVVRPAADAQQVHIEKHFDAPPHLVKGDPDRLQQALWNLLANAVKFSESNGRVTVWRPVRAPPAGSPRRAAASAGALRAGPSRTGPQGVSALVVDDDLDARELAALALANRGAYVVTVPDAAFALDLIAMRDIDVLVADLAMPGLDGYGLLTRVRAKEVATGRGMPAVAVTAHASPGEEARAIAAGFSAFVRKPYRFEDLVDVVASVARGPHAR